MSQTRAAALNDLFTETVALFHRLTATAATLHRSARITGGLRGVLRDLVRDGPRTVPQMARARPVSRQHIQTLVNTLIRRKLVELVDNPSHRRSRMVRVNARGRVLFDQLQRREAAMLRSLEPGVPVGELKRMTEVLRLVRAAVSRARIRG